MNTYIVIIEIMQKFVHFESKYVQLYEPLGSTNQTKTCVFNLLPTQIILALTTNFSPPAALLHFRLLRLYPCCPPPLPTSPSLVLDPPLLSPLQTLSQSSLLVSSHGVCHGSVMCENERSSFFAFYSIELMKTPCRKVLKLRRDEIEKNSQRLEQRRRGLKREETNAIIGCSTFVKREIRKEKKKLPESSAAPRAQSKQMRAMASTNV